MAGLAELFLFGAGGSLLTVYVAQREFLPELWPLYDIRDKEAEVAETRARVRSTAAQIDGIQRRLEQDDCSEETTRQLSMVLQTSLQEVHQERERLDHLERAIMRAQLGSRLMGLAFYVVLGGFVAAAVAGRQLLPGLAPTGLPDIAEALVVGTMWTSYAHVLGSRVQQDKARVLFEDALNEVEWKYQAALDHAQAQGPEAVEKARLEVTRKVVATRKAVQGRTRLP